MSRATRIVKLGSPSTLAARLPEIQALKASGLGLHAIARQLRMSSSSVHKALSMSA